MKKFALTLSAVLVAAAALSAQTPPAQDTKPTQDAKTDLPVIGVATLERVAAIGLAGIGLQAGGALIVDKQAVAARADETVRAAEVLRAEALAIARRRMEER